MDQSISRLWWTHQQTFQNNEKLGSVLTSTAVSFSNRNSDPWSQLLPSQTTGVLISP